MARPPDRFVYRVTITIGPAPHVPTFGRTIASLVEVLKRAGHDAQVHIVKQQTTKPPAP